MHVHVYSNYIIINNKSGHVLHKSSLGEFRFLMYDVKITQIQQKNGVKAHGERWLQTIIQLKPRAG